MLTAICSIVKLIPENKVNLSQLYILLLLFILTSINVFFQILSSSKFEYRFIGGGGFNQSMRSEDKSNLSKVCRCSKDECFAKTAPCSQSVRAF